MKLSKPDDDPNQSVRDDTDTTTSKSRETPERTVEVTYGDDVTDEVPVDQAVEVNRQMLMNPTDFGLASADALDSQTDRLQDRVDELEAQVRTLQNVAHMLAAESEIDTLNSTCDCGAPLEVRSPMTGPTTVTCTNCDRDMTLNGPMKRE